MIQPNAEQQALIDEYGELCRQIDALRPTVAKAKAHKDKIANWYADAPAEDSYTACGKRYQVQVGQCERKRKITRMDKLYRKLGMKTFLSACTFALGEIDKFFPDKEDQASFVLEERTGPRSVNVVALAPKA